MKTYKRICIKDYDVTDSEGTHFQLSRGTEYITSVESRGEVTVYSRYWFAAPANIFAGEIEFTE